ncbi:hypothetical protein Tco_1040215 [Tanacetum coccineum]
MLFPSSVPDTELVVYLIQDKLTLQDKSLDLSAFKLSCLFFSLLTSGSSSYWRSYGAQLRLRILKRCVHFNRMIDEKFGTLDVRLRGSEKRKERK